MGGLARAGLGMDLDNSQGGPEPSAHQISWAFAGGPRVKTELSGALPSPDEPSQADPEPSQAGLSPSRPAWLE